MALFTEQEVKGRAYADCITLQKSASTVLAEDARATSSRKDFDIFLSHSIKDSDLILGIKKILEDLGYSVYVDWIVDTQLDRTKVTPQNADELRKRMKASKSLLYVTTENSTNSKWMPWECGYFDGLKDKVAIIPIVKSSSIAAYHGQEYLGLYPYCVKEKAERTMKDTLWVHKNDKECTSYDNWIKKNNNEIEWKKEK